MNQPTSVPVLETKHLFFPIVILIGSGIGSILFKNYISLLPLVVHGIGLMVAGFLYYSGCYLGFKKLTSYSKRLKAETPKSDAARTLQKSHAVSYLFLSIGFSAAGLFSIGLRIYGDNIPFVALYALILILHYFFAAFAAAETVQHELHEEKMSSRDKLQP